jgi:acetoin utilization protein AcuB
MLTTLWMQKDVISIDKESTIAKAKEIFDQNKFRHLPVVDGRILVGIVTRNDINKALPSALDSSLTPEKKIIASETKISSIMTTNPFTAHPMDPLEKIATAMRRFKINAVPVLEDNHLVGVITVTDIFYAFAETLGAEDSGTRIEMLINKSSEAVYKVMEICNDFEMDLSAITLYQNYSSDHQLLTIKIAGENMNDLVDELWKSGARVKQILKM